ncbi:MAG TPA: 3'-5' exonuclease, partial [Thermomicrobiaceae bacterium]|nr:3'-5' exonuclease [Thermomicrobiaceae bacterium]
MNDDSELTSLIYGHDRLPRIVAVERAGDRQVRLFRRFTDDRVETELVPFEPWLVTTRAGAEAVGNSPTLACTELTGELPLRNLVTFPSWSRFLDARQRLRDGNVPAIALGNPASQYLTRSGRTLFIDMTFDNLVRLQIDIETRGLDPAVPDASVILIAIASNRGHREVIDAAALGEGPALERFADRIREIDPDVVEGHNIFNFDLPYLLTRARRHGVRLNLGRDVSEPRLGNTRRVKFGPRSVPFQSVHIYGRHIIDTYQQIQRYDAAGELESYRLKDAIDALGMTRSDRVLIAGDRVASVFDEDRSSAYAYSLGDVEDTALLSSLATPTEFYQTQLIPRSLQDVAVGGPGEKINSLLLRVYLGQHHSLPLPDRPKPYPGGYAEVRRSGVFHNVVKCDVESLYPAIMLTR